MMRLAGTRFVALLSVFFVAFTLASVDFAEARKGGSFGSRGTRTFQSAPPTRTAPNQAAPVERSMTPNQGPTSPGVNSAARQPGAAQRPGMFGGLGGSLMRGLLIGGLFGMLLGYGFGGLAGALGFIVQLLVLGVLAWLVLAWFRSRSTPATAGGPALGRQPLGAAAGAGHGLNRNAASGSPAGSTRAGGFTVPRTGAAAPVPAAPASEDIELQQSDLETFEQRLAEVQEAFSREDHAALRRLTTPEIVSYFSEELAANAQRGVRNDVRDVRLNQADIAEAWREGNTDYATAAFRYEMVDVMRDRETGAIVEGSEQPADVVELWTFVRAPGQEWKLSAIQEA